MFNLSTRGLYPQAIATCERACEIDPLAQRHGREVAWRPYLMGAVMKLTGRKPLVDSDIVARYAGNDLARTARRVGVPFSLPNPFPVATVAACRAYYWLADQDSDKAKALAMELYTAFFADGKNIGEPNVVLDVMLADGFFERVDATAELLWRRLQALARKHGSVIAEVRGAGLMIGLKCVVENRTLLARMVDNGLLAALAGDNVVRLLPPLVIEEEHVDEALALLDKSCLEVGT